MQRIGPQEASRRLRELANHIDGRTEPVPPDHNMVEVVDKGPVGRLPVSSDDFEPFTRIAVLLGRIGTLSAPMIPDVLDALQRINLVLHMWVGWTVTGKTIAEKTRSGPNDLTIRMATASEIERMAADDPAFEAGLVASLVIKRRRGEKCYTDWIPDGTKLAKLKTLE